MSTGRTIATTLEKELLRQTAELTGNLRDVCNYALEGGKRLRAALLLDLSQQSDHKSIAAAAALEMLHAATLLQDDIFDAGVMRRGRTAAHLTFGKSATILASDWLLVRALEMAVEVDLRIFRSLASAATSMTEAEAREFEPAAFDSLEEAQHRDYAIARGKTAALFATATYCAAILRGLSERQCECWQNQGSEMGLTYQIVDDCVDLYLPATMADKNVGRDVSAGCLTTPVLLALLQLKCQARPLSVRTLVQGRLTSSEQHLLQQAIQSSDVKGQMHAMLQQRFAIHASQAKHCCMPETAVQTWLAELQAHVSLCFPEQRFCAAAQPVHNASGQYKCQTCA